LKHKDIYLVAFYGIKPKDHVNTSKAGWMNDPNNIRYDERIEITRGVKKSANTAKIVMNLSAKTIEKNTWNNDAEFNLLFKYFFAGYHKYIIQVMTQLDPEYLEQMVNELEAEMKAAGTLDEPQDEAVQAQ
jgi:hypothetical protein